MYVTHTVSRYRRELGARISPPPTPSRKNTTIRLYVDTARDPNRYMHCDVSMSQWVLRAHALWHDKYVRREQDLWKDTNIYAKRP